MKKQADAAKKAEMDCKDKLKSMTTTTTKAKGPTTTTPKPKSTTKSTQKPTNDAGKPAPAAGKPAPAGNNVGKAATVNRDGVALTPDQPCCKSAAFGLCSQSPVVRNMCETECGCDRVKGQCNLANIPDKCKQPGGKTPPPMPKPTCADKNSACAGWAAKGECKIDIGWFMQTSCTKSCDLCNCPSTDINDFLCWAWAVMGECSKNPTFMKPYCGLSCCKITKGAIAHLSMAQRRKIVYRVAKARRLVRIKAARRQLLFKLRTRKAKKALRALALKNRRHGAKSKASALARRKARVARARALRKALKKRLAKIRAKASRKNRI